MNTDTTKEHRTDQVWNAAKADVRRAFAEALDSSFDADEYTNTGLFSHLEIQIIRDRVESLFYNRQLPAGGPKELSLAVRLVKLANVKPEDGRRGLSGEARTRALHLAKGYRATRGGYFILKPHPYKVEPEWKQKQEAEELKPEQNRNYDLIWFCDLFLRGIPCKVSNFIMKPFYSLVGPDSRRDRVVEIITDQGENSGKVRLDAESLSSPGGIKGFRVWLRQPRPLFGEKSKHGNGCWLIGERELQKLEADLSHDLTRTEVHLATAVGFHEATGIWFVADAAYPPDGQELVPDEDGVFWFENNGYLLSAKGAGNQTIWQKRPEMHPGQVLQFDEQNNLNEASKIEGGTFRWTMVDSTDAKTPEIDAVKVLFGEMASRLSLALGGYDAFFVMGHFLAFLAAPEFFEHESCFPGLWLSGETSQGKSTTIRWLMELVGVHKLSEGISFGSSRVGLLIALDQNSWIPLWLGDFKGSGATEDKIDVLHGAFNQTITAKYSKEEEARVVRTNFIVDGESSPDRTSTRHRFSHVVIAKGNRKGPNQVPWFNQNRKYFFTITRTLLPRRREFAALVLKHFTSISAELSDVEEREVQVHGLPFAAFVATNELLGLPILDSLISEFREFTKAKCKAASQERSSSVNIHQFFEELLSGIERGLYGETVAELRRFFKVKCLNSDTWHLHGPHGASGKDERGNMIQAPWKHYVLQINIHAVLEIMRQDLRKGGRTIPLEWRDLKAQMAHKPFYHEDNLKRPKQRFGAGRPIPTPCLVIDVNKMPDIGLQSVSDEEFLASKKTASQQALPGSDENPDVSEWIDPRKGPLFKIIEAVEQKPGEGNED